jgi:hypothetical protein
MLCFEFFGRFGLWLWRFFYGRMFPAAFQSPTF